MIPNFLSKYLNTYSLQRLKGIGLFCGIDYCAFFKPDRFYSRYEHSLNVALITYYFTKDKKATLAALFHDVSTPVFSHVIDFKNNDHLTQTSTEKKNKEILAQDQELLDYLAVDGITLDEVCDDHLYPIANSHRPKLCADRLEYLFATGIYITHSITKESAQYFFSNLTIVNNEIAFTDFSIAKEYFNAILPVLKLYQEKRNILILQLLADIIIQMNLDDRLLYTSSEQEILELIESEPKVSHLYHIFKNQTTIHFSTERKKEAYYVKQDVKVRYVDPLVNNQRLSSLDESVKKAIDSLISRKNTVYSYVL